MRVIVPYAVTDSNLTSNSVAEDTSSAWAIGTTYAASDIAHSASTHRRYESQVGSNLGNDPTTDDGTHWLDIGPTNGWAMFDQTIGTQTSDTDTIAVTVAVTGRADSVALLNIDAASARIEVVVDAVTVYDETFNLVGTDGINSWFSWLFEPIVRRTDLIITGLPVTYGPEITVTLDATGGTAKCGSMIFGLGKQIGSSLYGAKIGIRDFSRKDVDDFGAYTIVERSFSKKLSTTVWCDNAFLDVNAALLASLRATPVVWITTKEDQQPFANATTVFGFVSDWNIEIQYHDASLCSLEIEGLT